MPSYRHFYVQKVKTWSERSAPTLIYRDDPLGRLTRTTCYVIATSYGDMPQVEAAVANVRHRHQAVRGLGQNNVPRHP
jgi:uncharacterized protein (DUF2236 family)